jgi:hypothetical protein
VAVMADPVNDPQRDQDEEVQEIRRRRQGT